MIRYVRLSRADYLAQLSTEAEREHYGRIGASLNSQGQDFNSYYAGGASNLHDGLDAFCRSRGYQRATNVVLNSWPATIPDASFSGVYAERTVTGTPNTYYAAARFGINYPAGADCVRVVRK